MTSQVTNAHHCGSLTDPCDKQVRIIILVTVVLQLMIQLFCFCTESIYDTTFTNSSYTRVAAQAFQSALPLFAALAGYANTYTTSPETALMVMMSIIIMTLFNQIGWGRTTTWSAWITTASSAAGIIILAVSTELVSGTHGHIGSVPIYAYLAIISYIEIVGGIIVTISMMKQWLVRHNNQEIMDTTNAVQHVYRWVPKREDGNSIVWAWLGRYTWQLGIGHEKRNALQYTFISTPWCILFGLLVTSMTAVHGLSLAIVVVTFVSLISYATTMIIFLIGYKAVPLCFGDNEKIRDVFSKYTAELVSEYNIYFFDFTKEVHNRNAELGKWVLNASCPTYVKFIETLTKSTTIDAFSINRDGYENSRSFNSEIRNEVFNWKKAIAKTIVDEFEEGVMGRERRSAGASELSPIVPGEGIRPQGMTARQLHHTVIAVLVSECILETILNGIHEEQRSSSIEVVAQGPSTSKHRTKVEMVTYLPTSATPSTASPGD